MGHKITDVMGQKHKKRKQILIYVYGSS